MTGATGATGLPLANFISLFTLASDNGDSPEVSLNGAVPFYHLAAQNGSMSWNVATPGTITINQSGIYLVTCGIVTGYSYGSFTLEINSVAVEGGDCNTGEANALTGVTIPIAISGGELPATLNWVYTNDQGGNNPVHLMVAGSIDFNITVAYIVVQQIL